MVKLRWLLVVASVILVLGVAALIHAMQLPRQSMYQVVMPNGGLLEFNDATYGTNHVAGPPLAKFLARFPNVLSRTLAATGLSVPAMQSTITSKPQLLLWYQYTPAPGANTGTSYQMRIADERGFVSGEDASVMTFAAGSFHADFKVFPRRHKTLTFVMGDHGGNTNALWVITNIPNPLYTNAPQWTPEPLPATKTAGDLAVTLSSFSTGFAIGRSSTWIDNKEVTTFDLQTPNGDNFSVFDVAFKQGTNPNAPWTIAGEMLSDATGNEIANESMGGSGPGIYNISPSLWPDEAAWKLKLIVKRTGDFRTDELFTFKNIPMGMVRQTNYLDLATNIQGATITLEHFLLRPPLTNARSWSGSDFSYLKLRTKGIPEGHFLDLVEARSGTNRLEVPSWSRGETEQEYSFRNIPDGAKTFDVTFALHPSRSVEFLVKPVVGDPKMLRMERNK